jgi:hypothetical protein
MKLRLIKEVKTPGPHDTINDPELNLYRSPQYVLDLWGLGNDNARKARLESDPYSRKKI